MTTLSTHTHTLLKLILKIAVVVAIGVIGYHYLSKETRMDTDDECRGRGGIPIRDESNKRTCLKPETGTQS